MKLTLDLKDVPEEALQLVARLLSTGSPSEYAPAVVGASVEALTAEAALRRERVAGLELSVRTAEIPQDTPPAELERAEAFFYFWSREVASNPQAAAHPVGNLVLRLHEALLRAKAEHVIAAGRLQQLIDGA